MSASLLAVASPASAAVLTDGMNAANVLGQANFTSSTAATTQSGLNGPYGVVYDSVNKRLFVGDSGNRRFLVFDLFVSGSPGGGCPAPMFTLAKPNGGVSYPTLVADGVNPTQGYYLWNVPDRNTATARVRAELIGLGGAVLASDANFTIVGTPPPPPAPVTTTEVAPQPTTGTTTTTPLATTVTASPQTIQTYPEGTTDPVPLTAEELAAPATDPNATGGWYDTGSAVAATPTIDVDKDIEPPPPGVKLPCVGGSLVKIPASTAVYYCAKNGKRFVFPNPFVYFSWFPDFKNVKVITPEEMAAIPLGGNITYKPGVRMVKIQSDPKVYAIARDGLLRWVSDEGTAITLYGKDWAKKVDDVTVAFFTNYSIGEPVTGGVGTAESTAPVASASTSTGGTATAQPSQACSADTTFTEFLSVGSANEQVTALQDLPKCLGFLPSSVASTGYFGEQTSDAVTKFQSANGIDPRGYVGPGTREVLNGKY